MIFNISDEKPQLFNRDLYTFNKATVEYNKHILQNNQELKCPVDIQDRVAGPNNL